MPPNICIPLTATITALRTLRTSTSISTSTSTHTRALSSPPTTCLIYPEPPRPKPTPKPKLNPTALLAKYTEHPTGSTYRWETPPPTSTQLGTAAKFFTRHEPKHIWSAAKFKRIEFGKAPEVAFLGRSNVGKSSLLNALLNRPLAYTSSKPGRTQLLNAYSVAAGRAVLLDMPGYGYNSREDWGVQVMKYLHRRRELRRAFLLIDAEHGFKSFDRLMVRMFAERGVAFQIVLSKVDRLRPDELAVKLLHARAVMQGDDGDLEDTLGGSVSAGLGEIIGTAADPAKKRRNRKIGINELRWSVMVAMGLDEEVDLKTGFDEPEPEPEGADDRWR
ncbi:P-loop containing nucleoside triphosphate hydrolase protein [Choiromyces venosus 120613-1]|uniref:GTP-binding protein 8 n=1 Tax=Choiromyces venosus 120613-1 TaxID=1336337 RepID=A0A3N4JZY4_9PEZI|nr:P-loop containing nucleoside triphosphate hydrolase protein [Choiromyces venosus 120613-1]